MKNGISKIDRLSASWLYYPTSIIFTAFLVNVLCPGDFHANSYTRSSFFEVSGEVGLFFSLGRIWFAIVKSQMFWMESCSVIGLIPWYEWLPGCFQTAIRKASVLIKSLMLPIGDNLDDYWFATLDDLVQLVSVACPSPFFYFYFLNLDYRSR